MNKRIRSALATLTMVVLLCTVCILFRNEPSTVSVLRTNDTIIYAVAYRDIDLLEDDIAYYQKQQFNIILPKNVSEAAGSRNLILILEFGNPDEMQKAVEMLNNARIPSVILIDSGYLNINVETIKNTYRDAEFEFAVSFEINGYNEVDIVRAITDCRMKFYLGYGESAEILVHSCGQLFCEDMEKLTECECFANLSVFTCGNGVNMLNSSSGLLIFNRIVRLPDWSIADYFSSIAIL